MHLYRLHTSTALIASKLMEARVNAIKRNNQTWLLLNPAARSLQLQTLARPAQLLTWSLRRG
ncbi:MAG: hypothetical protein WKF30_15180 [Pyrinomonadaceae bacterium]